MAKAAHSSLGNTKKNRSRPVIAVALVVLVGAGGAWMMFHESGDGIAADESIPWSTMTDDRYVSDEPVDYTPKPRRTPTKSPSRTPSETPSETPTPSETATPSEPTDEPTSVPTSRSTTVPTSDPRPTTRPTSTGRPTQSTSPRPTKTPTEPTTPPWNDGGDMDEVEVALFNRINSARADRGCSAVLPHSGLSGTSATRAGQMAEAREYESSSGRQAVAGGDGTVDVSAAYSAMANQFGQVLFDCGLETLGVGREQGNPCTLQVIACLAHTRTTGWAATFGYR